jgi:ATP-binding cassette subfamily B protein
MSLQVAVGFVIPLYMANLINVISPNTQYKDLLTVGIVVVGLALLGLIFGIINIFSSQKVGMYSTADLRDDLFKKIQSLSFTNIDNFKSSRLITTATNDVMRIQQFFQMLLRIIIRAPLMLIIGLIFAIRLSPELSQIFYITIPLLLVTIVIIMIIAFPRFSKVQKTIDGINKVSLETANNPRVIKSFVTTEYENKRFEEANQLFRKINTSANKIMVFAEPLIMLIFNIGMTAIIVLGAYLVKDGSLLTTNDLGVSVPAIGTLMAFNSYSMYILFGLMMFAMILVFMSRALASAKRIQEVMNEEADLQDCDDCIHDFKLQGNIEFKDVSFSYESDGNHVLNNISFMVNKGERIGIIGSTGSGKSSLVNLIPRLYDVCHGEILLDGVNVKKIEMKALRNQIGFVTQTATIFGGSIGTNILQGNKEATLEELKEASASAQAMEFVDAYDDYFNHKTEQKGHNLSGGQKQRISIARAFLRKPKILILDDSTSAVDAKSEELILDEIKKQSEHTTTLLIAQKISTVKNMDNILVLNNKGEIAGFDNHSNLLRNCSVYQEIAQSQLGNGGGLDE